MEKDLKSPNETIDMMDWFRKCFDYKLYIFVGTLFSMAIAVSYSLKLKNYYRSEATLLPVSDEAASPGGALAGIVSMAGVSLGGNSQKKVKLAIQVLSSKQFAERFIEKHQLKRELLALKEWDLNTNTFIYDSSIYSSKDDKWTRQAPANKSVIPSIQEVHPLFLKLFEIKKSPEFNSFILSVEHLSPQRAKELLESLIYEINLYIRKRDISEGVASKQFLLSQLQDTHEVEMRTTLYKLIEKQESKIMLANVREDYVFQIIDPPLVPESKSRPSRALICVLFSIIGFILSCIIIILLPLRGKSKNQVAV